MSQIYTKHNGVHINMTKEINRPLDTPLTALLELVDWHTPEMYAVLELTERPSGGGSFQGNFWLWAYFDQGFRGAHAGTANYPVSHGWYLCDEDSRPFREWLKAKLTELEVITPDPSVIKNNHLPIWSAAPMLLRATT